MNTGNYQVIEQVGATASGTLHLEGVKDFV